MGFSGKFSSNQIDPKNSHDTWCWVCKWFELNRHALGLWFDLFNIFFLLTAAAACASVTISEDTNSYEVDARHGSWPSSGFCRVLHKDEINAGDPYTMTVELMNVIGWDGVNSGHPGVTYNAINETNFDFVYFRLVTAGLYRVAKHWPCFMYFLFCI